MFAIVLGAATHPWLVIKFIEIGDFYEAFFFSFGPYSYIR